VFWLAQPRWLLFLAGRFSPWWMEFVALRKKNHENIQHFHEIYIVFMKY